ncbi:MAG: DUF4065 domain-containing protein [Comamonadaceae bacterium]|nr:DUF4065 domain-containing protein [Comamonadaceae bacterium]
MAYSAYAIANAFITLAQDGELGGLTPMKLQKLMYFAQAWYLRVKETPLLDDHFSRWQHGPVIPAIYHEFKAYRARPIKQCANTLSTNDDGYHVIVPTVPQQDTDTWELLRIIARHYGHLSGPQLSAITHIKGSAWAAVEPPDGSVITHDQMRNDIAVFKTPA